MPPSNTSLGRHVFRKSHRRLYNSAEPVACFTCGAFFFYDTRANGKVRYCSVCKHKQILKRTAAYRKRHPDKHVQVQQRRRTRKGGSHTELFTHEDVVSHSGADCHLCGIPIDYSLTYPDPMSKSLDHVIPLSKGGAHTLSNVKMAHLRCNSKKGDRI